MLQVLGHAPYTSYCFMTTRVMAQKMMKQMHASDETDEETYIRHLAVFVRKGMIRHSNSFCTNKFVKYTA